MSGTENPSIHSLLINVSPLLTQLAILIVELVLGKENAETLRGSTRDRVWSKLIHSDLRTKLQLLRLYRRVIRYIDLLVDIQGHQILVDGIFNGDPHPGNLLRLPDGRLGLVDFGQTKILDNEQRLGLARIIAAVGNGSGTREVADAMRKLGFQTKLDDDAVIARYASLFFDSDLEGKKMGLATPQLYFVFLNKSDPLLNVPDAASRFLV